MYDLFGNPTLMSFDASRGKNPHGGKTLYVDINNGNDGHEGSDPEFPLAGLEEAYSRCTSEKGDYIFVQNFWTLLAPPLTINNRDVHIISLGSGQFDNGNDIDGGALAAIVLAAGCQDFELAGFNLGGNGASPAIDLTDHVVRPHIHHCTIGNNYACTDGIHTTAPGNISSGVIDHCLFGNQISSRGIHASITTGMIAHNIFRQPGVECVAGIIQTLWVMIFGNMFFAPIDPILAPGWAVHLDANSSNCFVMGNIAAERGEAPGVNPWMDETAAGGNKLNGWSGNRAGNDCTMPA